MSLGLGSATEGGGAHPRSDRTVTRRGALLGWPRVPAAGCAASYSVGLEQRLTLGRPPRGPIPSRSEREVVRVETCCCWGGDLAALFIAACDRSSAWWVRARRRGGGRSVLQRGMLKKWMALFSSS